MLDSAFTEWIYCYLRVDSFTGIHNGNERRSKKMARVAPLHEPLLPVSCKRSIYASNGLDLVSFISSVEVVVFIIQTHTSCSV